LPSTKLIRPDYSERFRCIGPACEDSCCVGWGVPIDQAAYEKYRALPPSPLRILLDENLERTPDDPNPAHFAKVKMPASCACPLLTEDRLCRIHAELGEDFLSRTCATYPRIVHSIDDLEEKALTLSCPEAARLVLLDPGLMTPQPGGHFEMKWDREIRNAHALLPFFWPIRELVLALVRNRDYTVWQRMFLVGALCRRLDAAARAESDRGVADVLSSFSAAIAGGTLRSAMEAIPSDPALQLDMVLRLAGLCRERSPIGQRFIDCIESFKQGIGAAQTATFPMLVAAYSAACAQFFEPFFAAHPHMLENYLVNTIFRRQFPFGSKDGRIVEKPETAREFALLATQFALVRGLLIGVAGSRKQSFSAQDVVHTVQSATKHFEHHPQFLDQVGELLASSGRDNAHGLTMLLRN